MRHTSSRLAFLSLFTLSLFVWVVAPLHAQSGQTVLFDERFDRGLDAWTAQSGAWTLEAGAVVSHHVLSAELAGGHPAWQDISLQVELELLQEVGVAGRTLLFFRRQGQWHGYGIIMTSGGTELVRFDGGPRQYQVLARSDVSLTPEQLHEIRIDVQGRRMTVYLDGRPIMQGMDPVSTYRSGEIGLRTEAAAVRVHRVVVYGPEDAPRIDVEWLANLTEAERILNTFPEWLPSGQGYHPPATDAAAGARNIMLIYTHGKRWNHVDALPYVAYGALVRPRGQLPRLEWYDWFFDTFLYLALLTEDKERAFDSASRAAPATWDDWSDFTRDLFAADGHLAAFNQAIDVVKESLDDPDYRAKVIIMIPYPDDAQRDFGDPTGSGRSLNFSTLNETAANDRYTAVAAYVGEILQAWERSEYKNLELTGFYWLAESVRAGDDPLILKTADLVHSSGHRLFWIPYFTAAGHDRWESLGFDVAIYQPNYMFNTQLPKSRLHEAAGKAYRLGMGVEIEANWTILSTQDGRDRYRDYLWAGLKYGFMDDAIRAYYLEQDLMGPAYLSTDPNVRGVYEDTYLFVKGKFGKEETSP